MKTFTARQPIFDNNKRVVAYELLFRESKENKFPAHIPDIQATSKLLLNAFFDTDISKITNGKPALVNFPTQTLKDKFAELLPTKDILIEVLETANPDEELFSIMRRMFHKGYRFALDDFVYDERWEKFLPFVKLIKIDIIKTPLHEVNPLIQRLKKRKIKVLAEKVETNEEFFEAKKMGFDFFQGFFFAQPEMIIDNAIPPSQTTLMSLYRECVKDEICFDNVNKIIQTDISITYKLLRYVNNSGLFKHKKEITSIKEAVVYIGEDLMRRFVFLIVTAELSVKKPFELMKKAIERAYFCESIAKNSSLFQYSDRAFLIGLFSVIDAILDRNMSTIVADLPLEDDIKKALVDKIGIYSAFIKIAVSYDKGEWDKVKLLTTQLGITEDKTTDLYIESIEWSDRQSNILYK